MMRLRRAISVLLTVAVLALGGCAANPVTHRSDFVLMSEQQELALGRQSHAEVLKQYGEYRDPQLQAYVQQVGEQLAAHSHRPELIYRFTVLDSKEVNAFALPGGYIYVTRGLLAYLNSEAELAAVLGHEIGHVTARHAVRQYSAAQVANIGAAIGSIFLPQLHTAAGNQLVSLFGTALLRGYGRDQELEADHLGAEYIARAGYQPTAMINVLRTLKNQELFETQLAKQEGREPRTYHGVFSTHPDSDTRLQQVVGEANTLLATGADRTNRDQYLSHIDGLIVGDSPQEGYIRGREFYHPDLGFGLRFPSGWTVKNLPDRLVFIAPQGAARLQMAAEDLNKRMPPREFMLDRLGLRQLAHDGPISPANLEGYTAVARTDTNKGVREARFTVIYLRDKAYVFAGLVDDPGNTAMFDTAFLDTATSFHPLSQAERDAAKPLRISLTHTTAGMTFSTLARESPYPTNAEAQLRMLNGRYNGGEIQPGELVKIVH